MTRRTRRACRLTAAITRNNRQGNEVVAVQFDAFPRRQGKLVVRVQEQGNGGQEMSDQKFVISNPVRGSFPKWTAEPLPGTKADDDLSVTLTKLVAGADMPYHPQPGRSRRSGQQGRGGRLSCRAQRQAGVKLAAGFGGNFRRDRQPVNGGRSQNAVATATRTRSTYQCGLWPDEPAWKVRVEFSQQSDFAGNELWTVQNIPLQPGRQQDFCNFGSNNRRNTNSAVAENDLNGVHLKIFPATQFTDDCGHGQMGRVACIVQATPVAPGRISHDTRQTDRRSRTMEFRMSNSGTSGNGNCPPPIGYRLQDIAGVTNLNRHPSPCTKAGLWSSPPSRQNKKPATKIEEQMK